MERLFYLLLIAFVFFLSGCESSNVSNVETNMSEILDTLKENLDITPYIPETDYKLGAVVLERRFVNLEPYYATINYYDSSGDLTEPDEEANAWFEEEFPERKVVYGTLYLDSKVISIEIYPGGINMVDGEFIDILGHDVKYAYYKRQDSDIVIMAINFDDVGYRIIYNVQSDNIEEEAKKLAEDIINNNS